RGNWDLGFSYEWARLTRFDGDSVSAQIAAGGCVQVNSSKLCQQFRADDFSLAVHTFAFYLTYGITDSWDINLLQPVLGTTLDPSGTASARFADGPLVTDQPSSAGSSIGPGDTFLRTKYRFLDGRWASLAAFLSLRFPSGNPDDFHGTGDFR